MKSEVVFTQLVSSKTRVAPANADTIPRLELLGALILARLVRNITTALEGVLKIDSIFCWLDSQIALWWIWGVNKEFKQFVQNRVDEIRHLVNPAQWNYCPSEFNPSDICSRGSLASKLTGNQLWWNGPEFLLKSKEAWPNMRENSIEITNGESDPPLELRKERPSSNRKQKNSAVLANIVTENTTKERPNLGCVLLLERFSSMQRLIRVTAYLLRFISNLRRSMANKELTYGGIKAEEATNAKELWCKEVQKLI